MPDDDWKSISLSASSTLSTAFNTATEAGHVDMAKAIFNAHTIIINYITPAASPEVIPDSTNADWEKRLSELEAEAARYDIPHTHVFKCKQDYENCMENAKTPGAELHCRGVYSICLGTSITKIVGS